MMGTGKANAGDETGTESWFLPPMECLSGRDAERSLNRLVVERNVADPPDQLADSASDHTLNGAGALVHPVEVIGRELVFRR
jgi:hypothetical protein